jgi:hypothetical protein
VRTASSTCREGFELWSWISSDEREDEEGEVRRGSEAEGSRFNVGVIMNMAGNTFYMNIFALSKLAAAAAHVHVLYGSCIWHGRDVQLILTGRKCETQRETPLAAIKKRAIQTATTFQYNAKYKGRNAISATFLLKRMALKSHMQERCSALVPQGASSC